MKLHTCTLLAFSLTLGGASLFAQGRGQIQTDQEKRNIAVVLGFWHDVWEGRDGAAVPKYVGENHVEHNNGGTNGLDAMVRNFGRALPAGTVRPKVTSQTVYARNEYVLLLQDRDVPDPADSSKIRKINMIEMFRVYDGKIQEHRMLFPQGQ